MAIALSEFWTRLVRSGITDAEGCKKLASAFSKASGTPPSDPHSLAKFMLKAGQLTTFQARALLSDALHEIRVGNFVIQSDRSSPPWSRWVKVARIDDRRSGRLFHASAEQLAGGRSEWLAAHHAVAHPSLQAFEIEPQAASTLVFSPMPPGRSLHKVIQDRGVLPAREACEIGILIADALEAMHARPLIHGAVRPDRVWISSQSPAILLRDPSGPPVTPGGDSSAGWFDAMDPPESYAAPEFVNDQQPCDQATDIYSLGCLLFRLVAGRPPVDGKSIRETIAAHATQTPPEIADAVARGESGDPFYRVLAFAMAKNPAARLREHRATRRGTESHLAAGSRPAEHRLAGPGPTATVPQEAADNNRPDQKRGQ